MENNFNEIIKKSKNILDIGTGPNGSSWYDMVDDSSFIVGLDLYHVPIVKKKKYLLLKMDFEESFRLKDGCKISCFDGEGNQEDKFVMFFEEFDLVVANNVFEHSKNPYLLADGIKSLVRSGGYVNIEIPDPENFTDIFYHLIHPDGGGHISFISKDKMIDIMSSRGFALVHFEDIEDDWLWLEKCYDWKFRGISFFSQEKIKYIADVFRKELVSSKGYYYGGRYIFRKL